MVDRFERFSFAIFEISRCWHKIASDVMTERGLKGPYAIYLVVLRRNEGGLTAARLCELSGRDKADVSRAVSLMRDRGLLQRANGAAYRALITLTEEGRKLADHVAEVAGRVVERAGGGLSDEHRELFYSALEAVTSELQTVSREGLLSVMEDPAAEI